jgi:hypothetical protein
MHKFIEKFVSQGFTLSEALANEKSHPVWVAFEIV